MQIIKSLAIFYIFFQPLAVMAQTSFLPQDAKEVHFIDKIQTLYPNQNSIFSNVKPYSRKSVASLIASSDSLFSGWNSDSTLKRMHKVDLYNFQSLSSNNSEWLVDSTFLRMSKKPFLHNFYNNKANFFEVSRPDFFLAINPVIHWRVGKDQSDDKTLYLNARGITVRGRIANRIGFSSTITDQQERGPLFFQENVFSSRAVPGVGFYKFFKKDSSAQDYFDGRGYLTFSATKYVDVQFGYDKNFIGNGYRSLFLSDWGNSYLFAKLNTKIWKFNYQNIFMELNPQFTKRGDSLLKRKYAAMHHLSINLTPSINVGLFEGVIFGRKDHFDFQYLNPIIFYRHVEGTIGSPDNAIAGLDFKANIKKRVQVYGQLLLDEFIISKIKNTPTYWANKFGFQFGAKYFNAFGIENLDLQAEVNRVRPFTYSHNDTINNYTHYNQPLAHPLGANFNEWLGIIRYQPIPKIRIFAMLQHYVKGMDKDGINYGGNIFKSYVTRRAEEGFRIGSGDKFTCTNAILNVNYEWKENLILEGGIQYRNSKMASQINNSNSQIYFVGMRLNMFSRKYDF
jgi:hypothetical protein